jgi:hypothetical protein
MGGRAPIRGSGGRVCLHLRIPKVRKDKRQQAQGRASLIERCDPMKVVQGQEWMQQWRLPISHSYNMTFSDSRIKISGHTATYKGRLSSSPQLLINSCLRSERREKHGMMALSREPTIRKASCLRRGQALSNDATASVLGVAVGLWISTILVDRSSSWM